jgi:hypothetical protein
MFAASPERSDILAAFARSASDLKGPYVVFIYFGSGELSSLDAAFSRSSRGLGLADDFGFGVREVAAGGLDKFHEAVSQSEDAVGLAQADGFFGDQLPANAQG